MKIQDYLKLIPDYPSDLPGFRLSEVVRWPALMIQVRAMPPIGF